MDDKLRNELALLETQVKDLLSGDKHELTAALPLAGILAAHDRTDCTGWLQNRYSELGIELAEVLIDRMRECDWDLKEFGGEEQGMAICQAQGLIFTGISSYTDPGSAPHRCALEIRDQADDIYLDWEAVPIIESWQERYRIDPASEYTLRSVACPLSGQEMMQADIFASTHEKVRVRALSLQRKTISTSLTAKTDISEAEEALSAVDQYRAALSYAQDDNTVPRELRDILDTDWTPIEGLYRENLSILRSISEDWQLSLHIDSPVLVKKVSCGYLPFEGEVFRDGSRSGSVWRFSIPREMRSPEKLAEITITIVFNNEDRLNIHNDDRY